MAQILCLCTLAFAAKPLSTPIEKIEPPYWWAGMQHSELQLMVYGPNIAAYTPTIAQPGVTLREVVTMDSPNYLVLYLELNDAQPGTFTIDFKHKKKHFTYPYTLKERTAGAANKEGFNSSDVVYLLMPDRFANGNPANDDAKVKHPDFIDRTNVSARHGGDIEGVRQHIGYLNDLGVTTIWMTPVFENDMGEMSYHGYAITDYYNVDPRFGSNEEYANLAKELQANGMKIIMDMVFNHCGVKHVWMQDPPSKDWFNSTNGYVETNHNKNIFFDSYASDVDYTTMTDGWFVPSMPDLNQRNPHLANYLIQNSIWWIEYANLNGIRQDTYPYPDRDMMATWCKRVFEEYPNFNIVGEIMVDNPLGAALWQANHPMNDQNTNLKTVMDFTLHNISPNAFTEETNWGSGLQKVHKYLSYDFVYPDINNVMRLLENHDMCRFYTEEPSEISALKQAMTLMLTIPGIPQLYYGQELLAYGSSKKDYGYIRLDMQGGWPGDSLNLFEPSGRTALQQETFDFMRTLLRWRRGNELIANGKMKHFQLRDNIYLYERTLNDKQVVVIMNGVSQESPVNLSHYQEVIKKGATYRDVITNKTYRLDNTFVAEPKGVYVLELVKE